MDRPATKISPLEGRVALARSGRIVVLDLLRAVAVLLVLGRHLNWLPVALEPGPLRTFLTIWQRGGWVGVDVFFVLSGFLVSSLLFREYQAHGNVRIGRFLVRRGLKIYPAFYVLLALTAWLGLAPYDRRSMLGEVLFLQNYFDHVWDHTWTLAIEEHFYLLLALLVWILVRRWRADGGPGTRDPFAALPAMAAIVSLACLLWRVHLNFDEPFAYATHFFPTHLRIDALFFGVLLSYLFHSRPDATYGLFRRHWRILFGLGLSFLSLPFLLPLPSPWLTTLGLTLAYLGSGLVLCSLMVGWREPGRLARWLAWWGGFSYSVYLWHLPIVSWVRSLWLAGDQPQAALVPGYSIWIYLLAASTLGVVFAKLVEFPVLALRDRLMPSRSAPAGRAGETEP